MVGFEAVDTAVDAWSPPDSAILYTRGAVHGGSGVVDRKRRLGNERQIIRILDADRFCVLRRFNQANRSIRQLAHCADDFGVARMTDQKNMTSISSMFFCYCILLRRFSFTRLFLSLL